MQYEATLPADYDMTGLTGRIAAAWHTLDDRAGLGLKAYLVRHNGIDRSPVNQYTCFYLWHDTTAMAELLTTGHDRFQNIIRFFGRPVVRHWTGIAAVAGRARNTTPTTATRLLTAVPAEFDLDRELAELESLADDENVHTAALAVDPYHWQLVRFTLWRDAPTTAAAAGADTFSVLHLSAPGITALPTGRTW